MASPRKIATAGLLAAALALAIALGSERFLGLIPCALCYLERWPYRAGIGVGLLGTLVPSRLINLALIACFLAAAGLATVHVGVEQHWWKSPLPECTAPNLAGLTAAERFARMPDHPSKSCEEADYLIPAIPITMTQANLAYALAVAACLSILLARQARRAR